MQNPIAEGNFKWILHRDCEGTEQLQNGNKFVSDHVYIRKCSAHLCGVSDFRDVL